MKHKEGTFNSYDGLVLFEQEWQLEAEPKGVVVIVHGLAEHSGRYLHVAEHLTAHDFAVATFDLRGHGRSGGKKAYVKSFDVFLSDLDYFINRVHEKYPASKIFLMGHSMGAAMVLLFAITRKPDLAGVIVSGAAVKLSDTISPLLVRFSVLVGTLFPTLPTIKIPSHTVSRDPQVVQQRDADIDVYHGGTLARSGAELIKAAKRIQSQMETITLPLLILHGTADQLADVEGSKQLYQRVGATDKTLKLYEGFYHEVLNELGKEQVLADLVGWLEARC